jgi:2-keto-3-deoxy-L-rhamnonate aldolase RhmA
MTNAPSLPNAIKRRLAADEPALGMVVRLSRSVDIVRIAKTSGMDFIFLDVQHAIYSLETIGHIAQAALGCGALRSGDGSDRDVCPAGAGRLRRAAASRGRARCDAKRYLAAGAAHWQAGSDRTTGREHPEPAFQ